MRGSRENLTSSQHAYVEDWDDGTLPDLTSGVMWTATAVVGLIALALPGSQRMHATEMIVLAAFAIGWGSYSILAAYRGKGMPVGQRAIVTAAMMPIVALALWASGGATSFIQPALIFTALFVAYFFPPRLAWPLAGLFVLAYGSPLLYDERAVSLAYPARVAMFTMAVAGTTIAIQFLKGRLVNAEVHQRTMAELDQLTGVRNRRGFDHALARATASREPFALVLIDLDDFKRVNDDEGHPAGDEVLRSVATAAAGVARQGDCVARIGGDEFAIIAPGAGATGALRLLRDLREAIVPSATFAAALAPDDSRLSDDLVAIADARLLASKRERRTGPALRR